MLIGLNGREQRAIGARDNGRFSEKPLEQILPDPLVVSRIDDPLQRLNSEDFEVSVSHVFPDAVARRHGEDELRLRGSLVALREGDGT